MTTESLHSGIRVGDAFTVERNGITYVIPTPSTTKFIQTDDGKFLTQSVVDKLIKDYFGKS